MAHSEQQVLRDLQDDMVRRAEQLVRGIEGEHGEASKSDAIKKGRTQMSKALEVAQSAGSLLVFTNWLRYQTARDNSREFWSKRTSGRSVASAIVHDLTWLEGQVATRMAGEDAPRRDQAAMVAATRYLGFLRRALIGAELLDEIMVGGAS